MRDTGETDHPFLLAVSRARKINLICGYGAMTPWDTAQLSEDVLVEVDALYVFEKEERQRSNVKGQFDGYLNQRRAAHPSYRKY